MQADSIQADNQRDAASMLYDQSFNSVFISLFYVLLIGFAFGHPEDWDSRILWCAITSSVMLLRIADAFYWRLNLAKQAFEGQTAIARFSIGVLLTCLCWGSYSIFFFSHMSTAEFTTVAIVLSTLVSGGATTLAAYRPLVLAYPWLMMLPLIYVAFLRGEPYQQYLAYAGLVFILVISLIGNKLHRFIRKSIRLKNERTAMIAKIEQEQAEVTRVNEELQHAYDELNTANNQLASQVKSRTEQVNLLSNLDPLTKLYNRAAFKDAFEKMIEDRKNSGSQLALLFIDLEGFKQVNDSLGHKTGDQVLETIAERINHFSENALAGRWGGDEFLLALPHTDSGTAVILAKALQSSIQQMVSFASNELSLGATIGIAIYPTNSESADELIQFADFAMYEQKKAGGNEPSLFNPGLMDQLQETQKLTDGLKLSIEKQQLQLYYQPIMHADSQTIWGYEALLRWRFEDNFVRPDIFIELAEQIGMIKEIGIWVLNRACIDASQYMQKHGYCVSVNVSIIQLQDDDFIKYLDAAISSTGIDPNLLHLEITESVFADSKNKVRQQLDAIRDRGIKVSIDDFGTGYSSLHQLQTLSVNHVKIDKSFVHSLEAGGDAIIKATLSVAGAFSYKTVAEGIETLEQAERLSGMGVNYLQGFYFAKPMPIDDARNWQEKQHFQQA